MPDDDVEQPVTDTALTPERSTDDAVPHLWPAELDAEYTLAGELGRGGMAVVFRARDRELGREVAVKVVRPRFAADEEAVARLAREARTVAQLEHPNIVGVYSIRHLSDRSVALVMQLIPGRTLKQAITEDGPFEPAAAEQVLRDIARALAYAHRAGVVHRDVKPENIFLDATSGRAMLSDFGVARVMDAPTELTATGTTIGTPTYMAPEQIDGVNLDGRSDLYSLGMVGWEMMTGERPWSGESLYSVIYRQKHDQLSPIDTFRPEIPPRLQYLIEGLMPKNPDRRWASAARFLTLLASDQPPPGFKEWESAQRRRRRSRVFQQTRERGGSVIEAALETVKFSRPPTPVAPLSQGKRSTPAPAPAEEQFFEPTGEAAQKTTPLRIARTTGAIAVRGTPSGGFSIQRPAHEAHLRLGPGSLPVPDRRNRFIRLSLASLGVTAVALLAWIQFGRAPAAEMQDITFPDVTRDTRGVTVPVVNPDTQTILAAAADSLTRRTTDSGTVAVTPLPDPTTAPNVKNGPGRPNADSARLAALPPASTTRSTPLDTSTKAVLPPLVSVAPPAPTVPALNFPSPGGTIAAGFGHSCTLSGGKVFCWGNNDNGQLGDGLTESRSAPGDVASDLSFAQVTSGFKHTCALTTGNDVFCWGNNDNGQLGDASAVQSRTAPVKINSIVSYRFVSAGRDHTCALSNSGTVHCWGSNSDGQLGDGSRTRRSSPVAVDLGGIRAAAIAVGNWHTCALTVEGAAYCWGKNEDGQLGDGSSTTRTNPQRVTYDIQFVSIAAGVAHTCAVNVGGEAFCWGRNSSGQLGVGNTISSNVPRQVSGTTSFTSVVAGGYFTCGRGPSGVWCWGANSNGQLGDGSKSQGLKPGRVTGLPGGIVGLSAGGGHACASTGRETFCWGLNVDGQISRESREAATTPIRVLIPGR